MTIILGIDPGSRITGFGVIHLNTQTRALRYLACGCIRTLEKETLSERLGLIFKGLQDIIQTYKPNVAAIEQVFLKQNVLSALKLGHARGAAMTACAVFDLNVAEYSPRAVKQAVVGYGGAEKVQVQAMIMDLLKLNHKPSADASDALAVAVCHGFHQGIHFRASIL
jgi:crossover junction endodeoxyribonuclease RuvC